MKRAAPSSGKEKKVAKRKKQDDDYHLAPSVRGEDGEIVWPAPREKMEEARDVVRRCAEEKKRTLIVPDKDADGLTAGVTLHKTLALLGLPADLVSVHLLTKGNTVHAAAEREAMAATAPAFVFVLDQGSRSGPPLVQDATVVVLDHHAAGPDDHPNSALAVSAANWPPVATTSLLTYELCKSLHPDIAEECAWLCAVGTHGDLGASFRWEAPFPPLEATFKARGITKKAVSDAVALVNAPRRTAAFDVRAAWDALLAASSPKDVAAAPRLAQARAEIADEVERCTHTPPSFSWDATIAVFRICSAAQVHPLIATRWANHLASKKLEIVLVANSGYVPDMVNFSCRIARSARERGAEVDIIARLREAAAAHESGTLLNRLESGEFARGHVQASGGIVRVDEFEELMAAIGLGEKPEKTEGETKSPRKGARMPPQKNTLANYFGKK